MQDALDRINIDRVVNCMWSISLILLSTPHVSVCSKVILSLQQPSGVFAGDAFGETDTRFLYCAVNALSLLGKLDLLDKDKAVEYIERCRNYDGGFGSCVGAESHAAQGGELL
jgi:geranylgeranyl transferase type-2 subunit beta